VTDAPLQPIIPGAAEASFPDVERALTRPGQSGDAAAPIRTFTATVVGIGPRERLVGCSAFLSLAESTGLRAVLIATDAAAAPRILLHGHSVAIEGLRPTFVNNAVAALRLSSLPTLVWWRGGDPQELDSLASLADRLVLDAEDPLPLWARVPALASRTAVSDTRWAALTRWRALMANFFDIPEVLAVAPSLRHLEVSGGDRAAMRLFAGWVSSALQWKGDGTVSLRDEPGAPVLHSVTLRDGDQELSLRLCPNGTSVETSARVQGHARASRTVPLGDQGPAALLAQELRIRTHDRAFEAAVQATNAIP